MFNLKYKKKKNFNLNCQKINEELQKKKKKRKKGKRDQKALKGNAGMF